MDIKIFYSIVIFFLKLRTLIFFNNFNKKNANTDFL